MRHLLIVGRIEFESHRSDSYLVAKMGGSCLTVGKTTLCGGGIGRHGQGKESGVHFRMETM